MADLEQMKQKYASVLNLINQSGVRLSHMHIQDNKFFLYEIIVKGNHVELKVDGTTVCDWTQPADFKGPQGHSGRFLQHGTFALQGHDPGSKVEFKDIRVKPLD